VVKHGHGQSRSQDFVGYSGGLVAEPPAAGGQWGSGGRAPRVRQFLRFFNKNNEFVGIFRLKFQF